MPVVKVQQILPASPFADVDSCEKVSSNAKSLNLQIYRSKFISFNYENNSTV